MRRIVRRYVPQVCNLSLRALSLAAKLALTLYMARCLGLEDLGVYGLVFAVATTASAVMGVQLEYVVVRDLVGATDAVRMQKIRDQSVFYGVNYVLFALVALACWGLGIASGKIVAVTLLISILDNGVGFLSSNLVAMERPVLSTFIFFLRAGLWGLVAVALGLLFPSLQTVDMVFFCWIAGCVVALVACGAGLSFLPWRAGLAQPVDWRWVGGCVRKSWLIWLGIAASLLSSTLDRFFVSAYLDLQQVGVLTFYSSFAFALIGLVQSGFFVFALPRLVSYHDGGNEPAFRRELNAVAGEVALLASVAVAFLGIAIPYLAPYFGRPELAHYAPVLWWLLAGTWIHVNADTLYYALYARRQDKALWSGGLLVLLPAVIGNWALVPLVGLVGTGYSAVLAGFFLFIWRGVCFLRPHEKKVRGPAGG